MAEHAGAQDIRNHSEAEGQPLGILDCLTDPVVTFDRGWRWTFVNQRAAAVFGRKQEDFIGRSIWETLPEAPNAQFRVACERVRAEARAFHLERCQIAPGVWVACHLCPSGENVVLQWREDKYLQESAMMHAFLLELADILRPLADPLEIQYEASRVLGQYLGADRAGYAECEDGDQMVVIGRHYTKGVSGVEGRHRLDTYGATLAADLRGNRPLVWNDVATETRLSEAEKAAFLALPVGAMADVPLVKDNRLVAIIFVHFVHAHEYTSMELSLMEAVAERTWAAVERARAEAALRESEERLRAITGSARDAIVMMDADGLTSFWNPAAERLFGYRADEILGRSLHDVIVPSRYREVFQRFYPGFQKTGTGRIVETMLEAHGRHKDGHETPVELSISPIARPEGFHAVGILRDISDRIRAQEELRASRQRLALHLSQTPLAAIEFDMAGRIMAWNPAAEEIFGYSVAEVIGRHWSFLVPEEDSGLIAEIREALLAQRGGSRSTNRNLTRSGSTIICEWFNTPLFNEEGKSVGFASLVMNITVRLRAEQELAQSNARLNLALASGQLGIWEWDIASGDLIWNDRMFELYGLNSNEISPCFEVWLSAVHPEDRGKATAAINAALNGPAKYDVEFRVIHPNGTLLHIKADGSIERDADGRAVRMIGLNRDVTGIRLAEGEKQKLQMQLFHAQKMESVGRLAGGIAHDFNNLLTVINGYSAMAAEGLEQDDPLRKQIEEIGKAGDRAASLTRQLLAFSRKQFMQPRNLDLSRIVMNMQSMLGRLVGEDIATEFRLAPGLMVRMDPTQLEQVIMNLAVNARDAMPDGGSLIIETGAIEGNPGCNPKQPDADRQPCAFLMVRDTGMGMDDATKEHIFEPFFTTKPTGEGTGLGLSMVQGIVEQSGGSIEVASEPGVGTIFRMYFPLVGEVPAASQAAETPTPKDSTETVLVVEDQAEVRGYVIAVLKLYGYRVLQASNAAEALAIFDQEGHRIHLVMTDLVMPNMSGRELIERITKIQPAVKVLFISGYTDNVLARYGVVDDTVEFLSKPFSPEVLVRKVRSLLTR